MHESLCRGLKANKAPGYNRNGCAGTKGLSKPVEEQVQYKNNWYPACNALVEESQFSLGRMVAVARVTGYVNMCCDQTNPKSWKECRTLFDSRFAKYECKELEEDLMFDLWSGVRATCITDVIGLIEVTTSSHVVKNIAAVCTVASLLYYDHSEYLKPSESQPKEEYRISQYLIQCRFCLLFIHFRKVPVFSILNLNPPEIILIVEMQQHTTSTTSTYRVNHIPITQAPEFVKMSVRR